MLCDNHVGLCVRVSCGEDRSHGNKCAVWLLQIQCISGLALCSPCGSRVFGYEWLTLCICLHSSLTEVCSNGDGLPPSLQETHILHEFPDDFYGSTLAVCVAGYIRAQSKFNSLGELLRVVGLIYPLVTVRNCLYKQAATMY